MNKYFSWFLFILSIASLWIALVILTSSSFSTQDMAETIYNFIGLCFFSSLFIIIILILIKYDFFKRKKWKTNTINTMKFSWNETIIWLCLLSTTITISAQFISAQTGIDAWSILYFGISLLAVAILIIIMRFIKNKKWKS